MSELEPSGSPRELPMSELITRIMAMVASGLSRGFNEVHPAVEKKLDDYCDELDRRFEALQSKPEAGSRFVVETEDED